MKNYLVIDKCPGSGITGKIIRLIKFISNSIVDIHNVSNIYIKSEILPLMNIIFESCKTKPDIVLTISTPGEEGTVIHKPIFANNDFEKMCKIAKLIRFNMKHIKYLNADLYDLSIHLRFTDMNAVHGGQYGIVEYEDYEKTISNYLNKAILYKEPVNRLFFATDNLKTREKIKKYLLGKNISDIYYNDNKIVSPKENSVKWAGQQVQNFKNINSYIEVINDAFNLSNSRTLIYRTSSVSNLAILLSKSLKKPNVILL